MPSKRRSKTVSKQGSKSTSKTPSNGDSNDASKRPSEEDTAGHRARRPRLHPPPYGKGYMGTKGPAREVIFGRAAKFQISILPARGREKRLQCRISNARRLRLAQSSNTVSAPETADKTRRSSGSRRIATQGETGSEQAQTKPNETAFCSHAQQNRHPEQPAQRHVTACYLPCFILSL